MEFLSRHRLFLSFLFIFLFSLGNLSRSSSIEMSFEGVLLVIISPFQKFFHYSYNTVGRLWAGITELNYLQEELASTRKKLEKYEDAAQSLNEIKRENDRLRQLLGYKERSSYEVIPAEILAKNPDNFYRVIIVNKGSSDGVKKYMPVISYHNGEKAIVGKVLEVRWNISLIHPVIDSMFKMGVMLENSRYVGLLTGNAPVSSLLRIDYISSHADISANENVLSSGEGGIFPKGLLVGKISKVEDFKAGGYKQAYVQPQIDFGNLDQVLIIKKDLNQQLLGLKEGNKGEIAENADKGLKNRNQKPKMLQKKSNKEAAQ